jgi:toxin ParE1/3/4
MNSIKLEIKSKAVSDIETIFDYIAQDNKKAARKIVASFDKTFNLICKHPELGRKRPDYIDKNIRFYVVKKHYLIIYEITDDTIYILRVLTAYQDICSLF